MIYNNIASQKRYQNSLPQSDNEINIEISYDNYDNIELI